MPKRVAIALLILMALGSDPGPLHAQDAMELTIPQARIMAFEALDSGELQLAAVLADGLLQRDPDDYDALMLLAWAQVGLGRPHEAMAPARRAYSVSKSNAQARFAAARVLAKGAFDQGKNTAAIWWLRRASDYAANPTDIAEVADGIASIRSQSPWTTNLQFSLSPSSNINGGAQDKELTIDGRPLAIFGNDAAAQSLSGIEATLDVSTAYKIDFGPNFQTTLGLHGYLARYALSKDAKKQLQDGRTDVTANDFSFSALEASLQHVRAAGSGNGIWDLGLTLGQSWYGGNKLSHYARVGVARNFSIGHDAQGIITSNVEKAYDDTVGNGNIAQSVTTDLQAEYSKKLNANDVLQLSFGLTQTDDNRLPDHTGLNAGISYSFGKPILSSELTLSLNVSSRSYPDYSFAFQTFERVDQSVSADAEFLLSDVTVMGFSPTLMISAGRTVSNVSRFTTTNFGVGFGLQSTF